MKIAFLYFLISSAFWGCVVGKSYYTTKPKKNATISTQLRIDGVYINLIDSVGEKGMLHFFYTLMVYY